MYRINLKVKIQNEIKKKSKIEKSKIKTSAIFGYLILLLIFSYISVNAVTIEPPFLINATGMNSTIDIINFSITFDNLTINNDSVLFNGLTFTNPDACGNTTKFNYNFTEANINISNFNFPYNCSKSFYLSYCNSTNNVTYINFTFKDITTLNNINASINNLVFYYYPVGYPSLLKSYTYQSGIENISYGFCMNPSNYSYYVNYSIQAGSSGYATTSKVSNGTKLINNDTVLLDTLFLYNSSTPQLITFQVINSLSQQLSGVYVYITDYFDINNTIISSGYTDDGGIIQFMMNNATSYKIYFQKTGYDDYNTILTPTETFYTITLSGLGITLPVPDDYSSGSPSVPSSKGVTFLTKPQSTYLENGTIYSFNLTIDSGTWTLQSWGFNLTDQNNNLIAVVSSTTATGGTLNVNNNTNNYTKIIMNFYYTINGNKTSLQRVWAVLDLSDNSYSISHTIDDATNYINSGLFGITTRGLSFIVFFIIFIGAGVLSYKFGLTSPVAICGFVFAMVWFFDVSLNWIPRPYVDAPIATILVGFVLVGFIVREVSQ